MKFGLMRADRKGEHYKLALIAVRQIRKAQLAIKADAERAHEILLVPTLAASSKLKPHIINQIDLEPDERISKVTAFSFYHGPDITIDSDGTAIEVKLIKTGGDLRACIGQALIYRFGYRFAIMVLVDRTKERTVVESLRLRDSKEAKMLRELSDELNIFTVIGPVGPNKKNLVFFPKSSHSRTNSELSSPLTALMPEAQNFPPLPGG